MTDAPNPFERMMGDPDAAGKRVAAEALEFERQRVRHVLARFGLKSQERAIARAYEAVTGLYELRFSAFCDHYPTFPFYLGATVLRNTVVPHGDGRHFTTPPDYTVHRCNFSTEPARFKMFHWVPFAAAYRAFHDESAAAAAPRRVGLVFPRKGFRDGFVIHDDDSEAYWAEGYCSVYKVPRTGHKLYVQPFSTLVSAIHAGGRGWRPL